jgi:WhiB family redox-sensing transcriptional regulator
MTGTHRPQLVGRRWEWQSEAACREVDNGIFYHPQGEQHGAAHAARDRAAKRVCAGCPVCEQCRRYALEAGELYGVWGGLTEEQRLLRTELRGEGWPVL